MRPKACVLFGTPALFVEVGVVHDRNACVAISVAADRDVKRSYKRPIEGETEEFTGISSPKEEPQDPEIYLNTSRQSLKNEVKLILDKLKVDGRSLE